MSQGAGNNFYGYLAGGYDTNTINNRIDYANDTATATPKGNLSVARYAMGATGNADFGYFGGGNPGPKSTVDRLDYSNDFVTMIQKGSLSIPIHAVQASGDADFGYFAGGLDKSTVNRIDYSNDTPTTSPKGPLTAAKRYSMGVSSQANALPQYRFSISTPFAFGNNPTRSYPYAYFGSGNGNSVPSTTTTMDRIDYANDTATPLIRGSMGTSAPSATQSYGETGNTSYGYFVGGRLGSPTAAISTVSRLDYSNDNLSTSVRGPLSGARNYEVAAGNQNFGWVVGGQDPSNSSDVDRINYANDTTTASPRGTLSFASACKGGASNTDFGWFAGGFPGVTSIVDRIDFSNDTATASPKGPLSETKAGLAAAGTQN